VEADEGLEEALRELAQELRERVKEFDCLYDLSEIVERANGSLDDILRETVKLLRRSWQYADVACARIVVNGFDHRTDNYASSPWKQTADVRVNGQYAGRVEVGYLEKRPDRDEGPFLAEERKLIDTVARRLSQIGGRRETERRLLKREAELRRRLAHLARVSIMGELAASIAHEVNQPLTAVATFAQACRRMLDAGQVDRSDTVKILTRIEDEALRAGSIIHRLESMVRKRDGERAACDVNRLVREVEGLASADSRLHDVRLRLDLSERLPTVRADGIQLQQVLLNLIRNGVDAMADTEPSKRTMVVRTGALDGAVRVSVTDHGCGVPRAAVGKLFRPFFTTKPGGTGMGLSICRSIVASHGGNIRFSADPGGGTTFWFTIPSGDEAVHGSR
jgi:C4-dicarboxylate-specific signal transduction histidine kinase